MWNCKIQWNSSNGQLHWFPIDFLWKWSIMDQNYANANASRPLAKKFKRYPDMPYESWRPGDSENVVVFVAIIVLTWVIAAQSQLKINEKSVKLAVWAVSLNFLHDFTLLVVDIHQIRLISLFRHFSNHFHFHGSAGLVPKLILTPRPTQHYISATLSEK